MKLTINLATRRYINMRLLNGVLVTGFLLTGVLLIFQVREVANNHAELGRIKNLSAASATRSGATVSEAQLKALAGRIAFANTLIDKKALNWVNLLDRLEEVVPSGVSLTAIEPDQRNQQLKITGAARSFANLRSLLENMEQSKNFSEVYLLAQTEIKVGQTQSGINFSVTCKVSYR
jgi:type IV pilus assembly protein PilN